MAYFPFYIDIENGYDYSILEEAWLDYKVEGNKNG